MSKKDSNSLQHLSGPQDEARTVRKVVLTVTALILGFFVAAGIAVCFYISSSLKPVDVKNKTEVNVEIPLGSTARDIGNILKEKELIKNSTVFRYYVKFKSETGFQAGTYTLSKSMSVAQIVQELVSGKATYTPVYKVTIPEGKTLDQIAKIFSERANVDEALFIQTVNDEAFIKKMQKKYPALITDEVFHANVKHPLEGYLYPATYEYFKQNLTIEEIVTPMIEKTNEVITNFKADMEKKNFTVHQTLTLASLIEEEATGFTDRQKISSVFYNRLKIDMPLQTDPTVLYALGSHKDRVLYADLEVDSPYNTYKVKGLTPGPIANAGEDSIKAALEPAETEYLYFLADSTGEVHYSKTLEEHNTYKAKYITNQ